jgi:hypothetical protein
MALGLLPEHASGAVSSVGQSRPEGGWRARWLVTAILAASVVVAYASPPDQLWISGMYDDHDYDDVLGMVIDGAPPRVEWVLVGFVLGAATGRILRPIVLRQPIRGPPIETRDAATDPLLTPAPHALRRASILLVSAPSWSVVRSVCCWVPPLSPRGYDAWPWLGRARV